MPLVALFYLNFEGITTKKPLPVPQLTHFWRKRSLFRHLSLKFRIIGYV